MTFTVPTPVARTLYNTAKRVVDELGKGQEILRQTGVNVFVTQNTVVREVLLIPDVDIIIVGVVSIGAGMDSSDIYDLIAPANDENFNVSPGDTNELITTQSAPSDDVVNTVALTGLNGNLVQAGQPIIAVVDEVDNSANIQLYIQISYILADEARTF